MLVDINQKILIWAREESGMAIDSVANKLKISHSLVKKWEKFGKEIPFKDLESIAKLYKRQAAMFFMPSVPQKIKKPKDYRNLSGKNLSFSPEAMLAIRRTERYLDTVRDLSDKSHWKKQYDWIKFFKKKNSIDNEIKILKQIFEVETVDKGRKKIPDATFRYWRSKIEEKLGIFVFQFPIPGEELDGFSYAIDVPPYAIVINQNHSAVKKIFTLFHELHHILDHSSGACKTDFANKNESDIEIICNSFAGKFLIPEEDIKPTKDIDDIFSFGRALSVSGETYLRRLFDTNKISSKEFFELLPLVKEKSNSLPRKKKENIPISRIIQSKSTRGSKFFNLVAGAAEVNQISYSKASDLLGLRIGSIKL